MDNDKNKLGEKNPVGTESESSGGDSAPRARNRTVMLTPEITGQVRARLQQDMQGGDRGGAPSAPTPDLNAVAASSFYTPGAKPRSEGRAPMALPEPAAEAPRPRTATGAMINQQTSPYGQSASHVASHSPSHSQSAGEEQENTAVWQKKTPIVGFLVSFDSNVNGDVYELRSGRLIVTSESSAQGNFMVVKDPSVSPMHAILRISQGGEIQVLDQLSEFGTRIKRSGSEEEVELSGDKGSIEHGDVITFGSRKFHVSLITLPHEG